MPRTGSQGRHNDLWLLVQSACYDPAEGHRHELDEAAAQLLDASIQAYDAGWRAGDPVPFSPRCKTCCQVAKRQLERRGLNREQMQTLFGIVGAKWSWTSAQTDLKRRNAETGGEVVVDDDGAAKLEKTIERREKARQKRAQRREWQAARDQRVTEQSHRVWKESKQNMAAAV